MKLRRKSSSSIYTYDDAPDVLRNKLGIKDFDRLKEIEGKVEYRREQAIIVNTDCLSCDCDFSLEHLCVIHKYLFGEIYDWAGQIRVTNINKRGGDPFCDVRDIQRKFDILHRDLKYRNYLKDIESDSIYTKALAKYYADLNYIHPFREGNGRTQRIFVSQLCELSGRQLDFSRASRDELIQASVAGMQQDYSLMYDLFHKMVINSDQFEKEIDCNFEYDEDVDIEYL